MLQNFTKRLLMQKPSSDNVSEVVSGQGSGYKKEHSILHDHSSWNYWSPLNLSWKAVNHNDAPRSPFFEHRILLEPLISECKSP
jgi:hypothetical protein